MSFDSSKPANRSLASSPILGGRPSEDKKNSSDSDDIGAIGSESPRPISRSPSTLAGNEFRHLLAGTGIIESPSPLEEKATTYRTLTSVSTSSTDLSSLKRLKILLQGDCSQLSSFGSFQDSDGQISSVQFWNKFENETDPEGGLFQSVINALLKISNSPTLFNEEANISITAKYLGDRNINWWLGSSPSQLHNALDNLTDEAFIKLTSQMFFALKNIDFFLIKVGNYIAHLEASAPQRPQERPQVKRLDLNLDDAEVIGASSSIAWTTIKRAASSLTRKSRSLDRKSVKESAEKEGSLKLSRSLSRRRSTSSTGSTSSLKASVATFMRAISPIRKLSKKKAPSKVVTDSHLMLSPEEMQRWARNSASPADSARAHKIIVCRGHQCCKTILEKKYTHQQCVKLYKAQTIHQRVKLKHDEPTWDLGQLYIVSTGLQCIANHCFSSSLGSNATSVLNSQLFPGVTFKLYCTESESMGGFIVKQLKKKKHLAALGNNLSQCLKEALLLLDGHVKKLTLEEEDELKRLEAQELAMLEASTSSSQPPLMALSAEAYRAMGTKPKIVVQSTAKHDPLSTPQPLFPPSSHRRPQVRMGVKSSHISHQKSLLSQSKTSFEQQEEQNDRSKESIQTPPPSAEESTDTSHSLKTTSVRSRASRRGRTLTSSAQTELQGFLLQKPQEKPSSNEDNQSASLPSSKSVLGQLMPKRLPPPTDAALETIRAKLSAVLSAPPSQQMDKRPPTQISQPPQLPAQPIQQYSQYPRSNPNSRSTDV